MSTPAHLIADPPDNGGQPSLLRLAFAVAGGPLAWFLQLNACYALADWPCFPGDHRLQIPLERYAWSKPAMVAITLMAIVVSALAAGVSWRTRQRSEQAMVGRPPAAARAFGRTCFLASWGLVFGAGFALTALFTGIAYLILPRCAG